MPDVLVVDDDRAAVKALCHRLEHAGFSVRAAIGGRAAIARFDEDRPRIVLLDAAMPDLSGFDVCAHIRNHDPDRQVSVIFMTGATVPSNDHARQCAELSGGDSFIQKPYHGSDVVELVRLYRERWGEPVS